MKPQKIQIVALLILVSGVFLCTEDAIASNAAINRKLEFIKRSGPGTAVKIVRDKIDQMQMKAKQPIHAVPSSTKQNSKGFAGSVTGAMAHAIRNAKPDHNKGLAGSVTGAMTNAIRNAKPNHSNGLAGSVTGAITGAIKKTNPGLGANHSYGRVHGGPVKPSNKNNPSFSYKPRTTLSWTGH